MGKTNLEVIEVHARDRLRMNRLLPIAEVNHLRLSSHAYSPVLTGPNLSMRASERVCVYACVYSCVYACKCTWVYACDRACMRGSVRACMRVSVRVCMRVSVRMCVRACV